MDPWQRTNQDRIKDAKENKEKGTEKYKLGDLKGAGEFYINALRDVIPIIEFKDEEEEQDVQNLKENCFSNLAACQLKLEQYNRVIINCTKSLELNDVNIKCLYRRAIAYIKFRNVSSAKEDVHRIAVLKPGNSVMKELETKLSVLIQECDKRDAKAMKSFLSST